MNRSGRSVAAAYAAGGFAIDHLVVAFDDMDLPLGRLRLRMGGGSGGHNGLRSVLDEIDDGDFARLRLGIGRPSSGIDPADHVLGRFDSSEEAVTEEAIERAARAIEILILQGPVAAMNQCNKKTSPEI